MIVEYTLEANGTIPTYIADGGYFIKANDKDSPQDWDMVGHTVNDDIPETLTVLDKAALITRLTNLPYKIFNPDPAIGNDVATAEQIAAAVDAFIRKHD
jgi:hypothetical protein